MASLLFHSPVDNVINLVPFWLPGKTGNTAINFKLEHRSYCDFFQQSPDRVGHFGKNVKFDHDNALLMLICFSPFLNTSYSIVLIITPFPCFGIFWIIRSKFIKTTLTVHHRLWPFFCCPAIICTEQSADLLYSGTDIRAGRGKSRPKPNSMLCYQTT